jgi:UDP-N-acetylglucosamine diphosphorylase/glucosamine-1-phosphate N-acetyltransferase
VKVAGQNVVLVVGHQADRVQAAVATRADLIYAEQAEQLGTGHAVMCALPLTPPACREVIILCGDVPLIQSDTLENLIAVHRQGSFDITVLAAEVENPTGYGRIIRDSDNKVCGIIEEADASAEQKSINLINTGIYCVDRAFLEKALGSIEANNAQGELYLTDTIQIAYRAKKAIGVVTGRDVNEFCGINTIDDLKKVENLLQNRIHIKP